MKSNKVNVSEFIFCIGYIFLLATWLLPNVTFINQHINFLDNISTVLLLFKIIIDRDAYSKNQLLLILIILFFFTITIKFSGDTLFLKLFITIIAAKGIDFYKIIKFDFIFRSILILFVFCCYKFGYTFPVLIAKSNGIIRNSLGFNHPNMMGIILFVVIAEMLYLNIPKKRFIRFFLVLILFLINHFIVISYTSDIAILLLLLLMIIFKNKEIKKNKIYIISVLPFLVFLISLILTSLYNNGNAIALELNSYLSNRLYYYSLYCNSYPINFLGNNIKIVYDYYGLSNQMMVLDNSYLFILLKFGVFVFMLLMISLLILMNKLLKNNKKIAIIFIIYILIGFSETYIFKIHFNPFLLYFSFLLFNRKEGDFYEKI